MGSIKIIPCRDYIDIAADYVTNEETIQEKKDPCNHTPKGEICDVHGDKDCSVKEENIEEGKDMEGMTQRVVIRDPPTKVLVSHKRC